MLATAFSAKIFLERASRDARVQVAPIIPMLNLMAQVCKAVGRCSLLRMPDKTPRPPCDFGVSFPTRAMPRHRDGHGVARDDATGLWADEEAAVDWYLKAVGQGHTDAQYGSGSCTTMTLASRRFMRSALVRRLAIPIGSRVFLRDSLAVASHVPEIVLRHGVALVGKQTPKSPGGLIVLSGIRSSACSNGIAHIGYQRSSFYRW
jgi:hypothetical protein